MASTLLCSQPEDLATLTEEHRTMEKTVRLLVLSSCFTVVKNVFHPCWYAFSLREASRKPNRDQRHAGEDEEQLRGSSEGTGEERVRPSSPLKCRMFLIINRCDPPLVSHRISLHVPEFIGSLVVVIVVGLWLH